MIYFSELFYEHILVLDMDIWLPPWDNFRVIPAISPITANYAISAYLSISVNQAIRAN